MSPSLQQFLEQYGPLLEQALETHLPLSPEQALTRYNEAVRHAVSSGGKRMRPIFLLLAVKASGGDVQGALPVACAVEYLHASSLVFDDLPAMDNSESRRSRPALHIAYDEGTAILVGLALFNQAYALLIEHACRVVEDPRGLQLLRHFSQSIGESGMIGGQVADLGYREDQDRATLGFSARKTTALMGAMFAAGALLGKPASQDGEAWARFGEDFGLAYQLLDDLLDQDNQAVLLAGGDEHLLGQALNQLEQAKRCLRERVGERQAALVLEFADLIVRKLFPASVTK